MYNIITSPWFKQKPEREALAIPCQTERSSILIWITSMPRLSAWWIPTWNRIRLPFAAVRKTDTESSLQRITKQRRSVSVRVKPSGKPSRNARTLLKWLCLTNIIYTRKTAIDYGWWHVISEYLKPAFYIALIGWTWLITNHLKNMTCWRHRSLIGGDNSAKKNCSRPGIHRPCQKR